MWPFHAGPPERFWKKEERGGYAKLSSSVQRENKTPASPLVPADIPAVFLVSYGVRQNSKAMGLRGKESKGADVFQPHAHAFKLVSH